MMPRRRYFFLSEPKVCFNPPTFWLGAAAIVFSIFFLGFLASRLPLCSPLAMSTSPGFLEVQSFRVLDATFGRLSQMRRRQDRDLIARRGVKGLKKVVGLA